MKIAIASDIHDNRVNLKKFLSFIKNQRIKTLILCGDICKKETLEFLMNNFPGKIFLTLGNADIKEEILKVKKRKLKIFQEFGEIKIDKLKIAFSHFEPAAKKLCQSRKYNFVFYGGDHKPWLKEINGCILANPGNLAGLYYGATFAVLDTEKRNLELKILDKINDGESR